MKLRLRGNSIRLRLDQTDVANLMASGELVETTALGARSFSYGVRLHAGLLAAEWLDGGLRVLLPEADAEVWASNNEEGIYGEVVCAAGSTKVALEKDWKCLAPRADDESAAFPHPREGIESC